MSEALPKEESSLLLYLESRAVDYGGKVSSVSMNNTDFKIAERWNSSGYIRFGRLKTVDIDRAITHWCVLSHAAWLDAATERRQRAERMCDVKKYLK